LTDVFDPEQRSLVMARVKGANTRPELQVRSMLHRLGYRFRLHRKDLPGKPDIVFPSRRTAIFVHGCFWHQHPGCKNAVRPASNAAYWNEKLDRNAARDLQNLQDLRDLGWRVVVVWECELKDMEGLARRLHGILGPVGASRRMR